MLRKLILSFLIICISGEANYIFAKNAVVKFVIGKVEIQASQQTNWQKLNLRAEVAEGDRIKTALNSRVELDLPDGSILKINENSTFDITELKDPETDNEDKMSFTLWAGKFWGSFKKIFTGKQERTVESPSAVVAIRGTTIEMEVDLKQKTIVRVLEGTVTVKSKDTEGEITVTSNQETIIEKGKSPTNPTTFTPEGQGTTGKEGGAFAFNLNLTNFVYTDPSILGAGIPVDGELPEGSQLTIDGSPVPVLPNGRFNTRLRVVEGMNDIKFLARKGTQSSSKNVRIYVNTKKPDIRLSTPLVAGFYNRRDYSLSGGIFDATPDDKIKIYVNGDEILEVMGGGSFNRTIILKEGQNNISVSTKDRSGNTSEIVQNLFLDTVKPILTVTEPAQQVYNRLEPKRPPGMEIDKFQQTIRGVIIDPEPSSGIKRISVNGKEIQPNSDGSFETTIMVRRGNNNLNFIVEDLAGNILRDNTKKIKII